MRAHWMLLLLGLVPGALGHTYHLGNCPQVEPMAGFQMSRVSRATATLEIS